MKNRASSSLKGFTLVEVMAAVAIGSLVIIMVLGIMRYSSDGFSNSTRKIDSLVEARAALKVLSNDASSAVRNGNFELTEDEELNMSFMTLKTLKEQTKEKANGDLCLVQYFTEINRETPNSPLSRKLYRRLINSAEIANTIREGDEVTAPKPDATADGVEIVAFNVVKLSVKADTIVKNANGTSTRTEWKESSKEDPSVLEFSFLVLDNQTAQALGQPEDWNLQTPLSKQLVGDQEKGVSRKGNLYTIRIPYGYNS